MRAQDDSETERDPSPAIVNATFLESARSPNGSYRVNHLTVCLGRGRSLFDRASLALHRFGMVNELRWIEIHCKKSDSSVLDDSIAVEGAPLCTVARCLGFIWIMNPCRVVRSTLNKPVDNPKVSSTDAGPRGSDPARLSEVAFTTMNGHMLSGEERFRVFLQRNGDVKLDLYSFSRPSHALGLLVLPYVRWVQGRFFKEIATSMQRILSREIKYSFS